jgi:hypothetical protein
MRAVGVSRQDYQIFWGNTVGPAASAVRSARVALQQGRRHADDDQGLGFDTLSRSAMTLDVTG